MQELDTNVHSVFSLHDHLIFVVKYRRKVLRDKRSDRAREIFEYICPHYNITLVSWNHDMDHVHILFKAHPNSELSKFIRRLQECKQPPSQKRVPVKSRSSFGVRNSGPKAFV
jgi:putative transposase